MNREEQDKASLFGAAIAVHRQLNTKLSGMNKREELWKYVLWIEGKSEAPDGDAASILKSMKMVEQMIMDNAP